MFLVIPIIFLYVNGSDDQNNLKGYAKYSIATLGFDSMQCASISFYLGTLLLFCPYGEITGLVENGFGINAYTNDIRDACMVNDTLFHNKECSDLIHKKQFEDVFQKNCHGKKECKIDVNKENLFVD